VTVINWPPLRLLWDALWIKDAARALSISGRVAEDPSALILHPNPSLTVFAPTLIADAYAEKTAKNSNDRTEDEENII
jgi:hypothetical protein